MTLYFIDGEGGRWLMCRHGNGSIEAITFLAWAEMEAA